MRFTIKVAQKANINLIISLCQQFDIWLHAYKYHNFYQFDHLLSIYVTIRLYVYSLYVHCVTIIILSSSPTLIVSTD